MKTTVDQSIDMRFSDSSFYPIILLNEIVTGQKEEYINTELAHVNKKFNVEFKDYYVLLTGIKKEIYNGIYHIETEEYLRIFRALEAQIIEYLSLHHFRHEIFMYFYFNTKQICILLNRGNHSDSDVEACGEYINDLFQQAYEKEIFKGENRHFNFTAVSPLLEDYGRLAPAFARLQELVKLSFFHRASMVMTDVKLSPLKKVISYPEIRSLMDKLIESVSSGQVELCGDLSRELFLQHLKPGYDLPLCRGVLEELKEQVSRLNTLYNLNLDDEIDEMTNWDRYAHIDEMHCEMGGILQACTAAILRRGREVGYLTREAVKFIKENYNRNIALADIAEYVKAAPTYISEVFNRETGMSIPRYLAKFRIEKSKKLLISSHAKIHEISKTVGINDANYFGKLFKKYEGLSPQQFLDGNRTKGQIDITSH